METESATETGDPAAAAVESLLAAKATLVQFGRTLLAAFALMRAELRLARASAARMLVLVVALVVMLASAWLLLLATLVIAVQAFTGSLLLGLLGVLAANLLGALGVILALRRCVRDLGLPHTREVLGELAVRRP